MNHLVFISYSTRNTQVAQKILKALEDRNISCWIAPRDIIGGMEYGDVIDDAVNACKVMVVIFSESSSNSQWVRGELNLAFSAGKSIVPYKIDDTALSGAMRLMLNDKHWISADSLSDAKVEELVHAVEVALEMTTAKQNQKIRRRKILKIILPILLTVLIAAAVLLYFSKSKNIQNQHIEQYKEVVQKGDFLVKSGIKNYSLAIDEYQKAMKMELNVPEEFRLNLQEKTTTLQKCIDSAFFRLVDDGDFFAEIGTENGIKQAMEKYETALLLKESELVRIKLNKLKFSIE